MGCFSFKWLWKKNAVSAVWIFHAVLRWREAADPLSGHNIGPLPQRKQHLLWQPVRHFLSIPRALSSWYKLKPTITTWTLTCKHIVQCFHRSYPHTFIYLKIHQKQSSVKSWFHVFPHSHNIPDSNAVSSNIIFFGLQFRVQPYYVIQCAFECTLTFCTLSGLCH